MTDLFSIQTTVRGAPSPAPSPPSRGRGKREYGTQIADARHGITGFTYDPNGNLLTVTDALGQTTTYTYDVMDRLKTRTDPLQRTETYDYDAAGNLITFTDRKNQISTFEYDALNRRTKATFANGRTRRFLYDAVGRLAQAGDSVTGVIEWRYDALDRLLTETTPQGTVQYVYDALGRRRGLGAPGQLPVAYLYDAASRLTDVVQGSLAVGLGYDAAGRRTSLTYPNGTNASYTYDNASRLTNILHQGPAGVIESLSYVYDAAGNRISLTRANGAASVLPAAVQAAYDAANEQIQFSSGSPNQTFDANGNLTFDGVNTYTWDALNQLEAISGPGLSASFEYDALGRRISKTINGVTTSFLYDGNDIIAEIEGGTIATTYIRSLNIDEPFIRQTASGTESYHTDALGSTLALTNSSGQVTTTHAYETFGKTTITGTSSNPFHYTGRENDGTGLYHYRARYLSPKFQRFISEDPIGLFGGDINLYAYVWNIPTMLADPHGLAGRRQEPHFDPYRHGGPHFDLPQGRYDAQTLKPLPHKGVTPPELTQNQIRSLKESKAYKQWLKFAKEAAKIGGIALGIFLELVDPAEAGDPDLDMIDLGQRKTE